MRTVAIRPHGVNSFPKACQTGGKSDPLYGCLTPRAWIMVALSGRNLRGIDLGLSPATLKRARAELRGANLPPVLFVPKLSRERICSLYRVSPYALPIYHEIARLGMKRLHDVPHWYLARKLGISRRSVIRAIKALQRRGLFFTLRRFKMSNLYAAREGRLVKRDHVSHSRTRRTYSSSSIQKKKTGKPDLILSRKKVRPPVSFEKLLASSDSIETIEENSPGSKKLNRFRRPDDPDLFRLVSKSKFVQMLSEGELEAENYRADYWDRVFQLDEFRPSELCNEEFTEIVEGDKNGLYEDVKVTEQIDKLARKALQVYNVMLRARRSLFFRVLPMDRAKYVHFCRLAHLLLKNGFQRHLRLWMIAQFDAFEEFCRQGIIKGKRATPQPGFFYSGKAVDRFQNYLDGRRESFSNRVCKDEMIASALTTFADVQEAAYHRGRVMTARSWLKSEESKLHLGTRALLGRFFGIEVKG